jgi:hypothetical protein
MNDSLLRQRIRSTLLEQRALVGRLLGLREQLRGSLFVRYAECGKEACSCRTGPKHGPYYVLSARTAVQQDFSYVQGRKLSEVRSLVQRYKAFKDGLRRLRKVNADLVTLLARYQRAMIKKGGRRVGVGASA